MLKLGWIEFFLRTIPEVFILVWGIYIISRKNFDIKKYICASVVLSILSFLIRYFPIYFGVHMIVNMVLIISIMCIVGIPFIKVVYSTFLIFLILSLSEFINMVILRIFNIETSIEFLNHFIKCIYGIPSLVFVSLFIITINHIFKMKEGRENVYN